MASDDAASPSILVVDSDTVALERTVGVLRRAGYRVTGVNSFQWAKHLLVSNQPELMIADVRLGAFNGLHLVLRRRSEYLVKPSIVTNSEVDPVLERQAHKLGAPYLVKPLSPEVLLRVAKELLESVPPVSRIAGHSVSRGR